MVRSSSWSSSRSDGSSSSSSSSSWSWSITRLALVVLAVLSLVTLSMLRSQMSETRAMAATVVRLQRAQQRSLVHSVTRQRASRGYRALNASAHTLSKAERAWLRERERRAAAQREWDAAALVAVPRPTFAADDDDATAATTAARLTGASRALFVRSSWTNDSDWLDALRRERRRRCTTLAGVGVNEQRCATLAAGAPSALATPLRSASGAHAALYRRVVERALGVDARTLAAAESHSRVAMPRVLLVLVVGMPRSASTFLYNAARLLLGDACERVRAAHPDAGVRLHAGWVTELTRDGDDANNVTGRLPPWLQPRSGAVWSSALRYIGGARVEHSAHIRRSGARAHVVADRDTAAADHSHIGTRQNHLVVLAKMHGYHARYHEHAHIILTSHRDVRASLVSDAHRWHTNVSLSHAAELVEQYEHWAPFASDDMCMESMSEDPTGFVMHLRDALGLSNVLSSMTRERAQAIVDTIERARTQRTADAATSATTTSTHDPLTVFHAHHNTDDGARWREVIDARTRARVERVFGDWLRAHSYEM